MSAVFRSVCKTKEMLLPKVVLKFREVSNSFWEGTRREKICLKKVFFLFIHLVNHNKIYTFTCGCIVLSTIF